MGPRPDKNYITVTNKKLVTPANETRWTEASWDAKKYGEKGKDITKHGEP